MIQMPQPMVAAPRASQPGFHDCRLFSERTTQRSPRALATQATMQEAAGVTAPNSKPSMVPCIYANSPRE